MANTRGTTILIGLLAAACGLTGVHAVRPAGSSKVQTDAPAGSSKAPEPSKASPRTFDVSQFRPLLAEPQYEAVRALVDEEKPAEAAAHLQRLSAEAGEDSLKRARSSYLAGLLYRQSGGESAALNSFRTAAGESWILRDDAGLHVAELLQRTGQFEAALEALGSLSQLADTPRSQTIRASSLSLLKRQEEAVVVWRSLADATSSASARLALAQDLLVLCEAAPPGAARQSLASEAALEAEKARLGLPPENAISQEVDALLRRAVAAGAATERELSVEQRLLHLRGLVEQNDLEAAEVAAKEVVVPDVPKYSPARCERDYLVGKLLAAKREWGQAADKIGGSADNCTEDPALHSWLLFNAGKYSAADGRQTQAIRYYADLERLYPKSSLADDARLRAARSYETAGVPAKFTALLSTIAEDYPDGDTTMEGVLALALYRIERGDWSGASQVLESAVRVVRETDSARGHEYSGTERYFLARARHELGEEEAALLEYESIVREVPLSYYMLHAYSRLLEASPARAKVALAAGLKLAEEEPFEFPHRPEYDTQEFLRGMELLRVGDTESGQQVLDGIGLGAGADDALLWGMALLYDRAGDAHTSHNIARGRLTDWFAHYPEGDWQGPWELGFPRPYHEIVARESKATGVPEWFIYGIMREESTFRAEVVSSAEAYGLMQVIVPTARVIGKKSGHPYSPAALIQPAVNIAIGSRVLEELGRQFRINPWLAIPGYNAGPGRPSRWLRERPQMDFDVWVEMIPYRETRRYTKRVLASRAAYAFVYYREEAQTALVLPRRLTAP